MKIMFNLTEFFSQIFHTALTALVSVSIEIVWFCLDFDILENSSEKSSKPKSSLNNKESLAQYFWDDENRFLEILLHMWNTCLKMRRLLRMKAETQNAALIG